MAEGGLLLTVVAALGFLWPRLLAWPLAAISLWLGLALLARSVRRRAEAPPAEQGRSHTRARQATTVRAARRRAPRRHSGARRGAAVAEARESSRTSPRGRALLSAGLNGDCGKGVEAAMRFRVMTYNIHRAIGVDRRFRPERMVRIIESHAPDIVLLQEVDDGVPRSREMDLARELATASGYPHVAVGHNVTLRKGRYGNATLSRHPILRERNIDLTIGTVEAPRLPAHRHRPQRPARAAATGSRSSTSTWASRPASASGRWRSSPGPASWPRLPADVACLVGGDFNDWRSLLQPVLHRTAAVPLRHRPLAERRDGRFPPTRPSSPGVRSTGSTTAGRSGSLSVRRCRLRLSRIASDHLPIVADFEIH